MTSKEWTAHFAKNAKCQRIDWTLAPSIYPDELENVLASLQAWQLGETSDGNNLLRASTLYAQRINDADYVEAVKLFIREEQKHGNNLGRYLDAIQQPRITKDWGDSIFRKIRYFNTNMEIWTLTVIVVESTAQVFYQALKDATSCTLLKQICTDILIDEAYHIDFQTERMTIIFEQKSMLAKLFRKPFFNLFFHATSMVVWFAHRRLFKAGGNTFSSYMHKMHLKYKKTLHRITTAPKKNVASHQPLQAATNKYLTQTMH